MKFDERTEKNIATLHPKAQEAARRFMEAVLPEMAKKGVVVKIISGTRTYAEQQKLYNQPFDGIDNNGNGRIDEAGERVTKAKAGYSNHNFGVAWDIGLFQGAKYLEESPLYKICGQIGCEQGLEWGGDWKSIVDEPHFEVKTGLSMAEKRARVAAGVSIL